MREKTEVERTGKGEMICLFVVKEDGMARSFLKQK